MIKRRRCPDDITENSTPPQLLVTLQAMDNQRDAALCAFIYLTGCRISEIVGKEKVIPIYKKNEEGKRELIGEKRITIPPLYKENVNHEEEDVLLVTNVSCLKRRDGVPKRNIPIRISSDRGFVELFIDYYNGLPNGSPLFPITRQRAWQIVNKKLGLYTHYLIHERCTYLVTKKGLTDMHLKQLRGWSDTKPAQAYVHLRWQDLADKI